MRPAVDGEPHRSRLSSVQRRPTEAIFRAWSIGRSRKKFDRGESSQDDRSRECDAGGLAPGDRTRSVWRARRLVDGQRESGPSGSEAGRRRWIRCRLPARRGLAPRVLVPLAPRENAREPPQTAHAPQSHVVVLVFGRDSLEYRLRDFCRPGFVRSDRFDRLTAFEPSPVNRMQLYPRGWYGS
jgi:hypothetical protein